MFLLQNKIFLISVAIIIIVLFFAKPIWKMIKRVVKKIILYVFYRVIGDLHNISKEIFSYAITYITFITHETMRKNSAVINTAINILENNSPNNSNIDNLEILANTLIEDSNSIVDTSNGHNLLSKILLKKGKSLDLFKSISNISQSLNILHNNESIQLLFLSLLNDDPEYKDFNVNTIDIRNTEQEIIFLKKIIDTSSNNATKLRALYRLSFIYTYGQSTCESSKIDINYFKALKNRNLVFQNSKNTPQNIIHVALVFDEKYAIHAGATIASLLFNANPDTFYKIYAVEDPDMPISQESKQKLKSMRYIKDHDIEFIKFPNEILQDIDFKKHSSKEFPKMVWYRILLSEILNIPKIIYLDTDVIVHTDLSTLYNKDISNYYFAGSVDIGFVGFFRDNYRHGLFYINSGVLLINLALLKQFNLKQKILDNIDSKYIQGFFDQDFINYVFKENIYSLSTKWSSFILTNDTKIFNIINNNKLGFIYHFIGDCKPWRYPSTNTAVSTWQKSPDKLPIEIHCYWHYRDLTPWSTKPDLLKATIDEIQKNKKDNIL